MSRLQPIIDAIDRSPNHTIDIKGYKCMKDKYGTYRIGCSERILDSLISITRDKRHKDGEVSSRIVMSGSDIMYLGQVYISSVKEESGIQTIGLNDVSRNFENNTILENAINSHYVDPQTDKKRQLSVQQVLTMLDELGVKLTPTENMEMLRGKKQFLEEQLAQVKKELAQKESQQK